MIPNENLRTLKSFNNLLTNNSNLFTGKDWMQLKTELEKVKNNSFKFVNKILDWSAQYADIDKALTEEAQRCNMVEPDEPTPEPDPVLEDKLMGNIMIKITKKSDSDSQEENNDQNNS